MRSAKKLPSGEATILLVYFGLLVLRQAPRGLASAGESDGYTGLWPFAVADLKLSMDGPFKPNFPGDILNCYENWVVLAPRMTQMLKAFDIGIRFTTVLDRQYVLQN